MGSDIVLKIVQVCAVSLLIIPHFSWSLFEGCDESYNLDTDENIRISSHSTLNVKNVSSCRYIIAAPPNYVVKVTCELKFDQLDSTFCRTKRFFVSVDGISSLNHAHNFCNKNGTIRIIRRRSVMNRLVMAYVSKRDLEDETFTCTAWRVKSKCECGWSRRVRIFNQFLCAIDISNVQFSHFVSTPQLNAQCHLCPLLFFSRRREFTMVKMHKCMNSHQ